MNRRPRCSALFGALLLLGSAALCPASAPTTPAAPPKQAPESQAPKAIPAPEITRRAEQTTGRVREIWAELEADTLGEEIHRQLETTSKDLDELSRRLDTGSWAKPEMPLREEHSWLYAKSIHDRLQDQLRRRSERLESLSAETTDLREVWVLTREAAMEDNNVEAIIERIDSTLKSIAEIQSIGSERLDAVLTLQERTLTAETRINDALELIASVRRDQRGRLLARDAPPLWAALVRPDAVGDDAGRVRDTWENNREALRIFWRRSATPRVIHAVILVVLLGLFLYLRFLSRQWARDASSRRLSRVVSRPVAASFLVGLVFTAWIYPPSPHSFYVLIGMLSTFPLLRLLPRLVWRPLLGTVYTLTAVFFVDRLVDLVAPQTLLQRAFLLIEVFVVSLILVRTLRPGGPARRHGRGPWWRITLVLCWLGLGALVVAAVSNVLGSVSLATLVTSGLVVSAYLGLVLFAISMILDVLVAIGLRFAAVEPLGWGRRRIDLLSRCGTTAVRLLTAAGWAYYTLTFLGIWSSIRGWFVRVLEFEITVGNFSLTPRVILLLVLMLYIASRLPRLVRFVRKQGALARDVSARDREADVEGGAIDLFISYSRDDQRVAERLATLLSEQGWTVFWDRTIPAGKTWRDVIGAALASARCVVVLWSTRSVQSDWVLEEADRARKRRKLIPARIEDVDPPLGFGGIQAADLCAWRASRAKTLPDALLHDITGMLGPSPTSARLEKEGTMQAEEESRCPAQTDAERTMTED